MKYKVYLLSLGMFSLGLDAYVVAGLLQDIANTYAITASQVGMTVGVFTLCYAFSAPIFATLLGHKSAKTTLAVALTLFSTANMVSAVAPTFSWLLISRAVAGMGAGFYSPLAAASATTLVGPEKKGRVLGIILGGMSLGTVIGVPCGLLIAKYWGWQVTLLVVSLVGYIALAGILILFPKIKIKAQPTIKERFALLVNIKIIRVLSVTMLLSISSLGLYTYIQPISDHYDCSEYLGLFFSSWGLGGMIGSFSIGYIIDKLKKPDVITCYISFLLAATLFLLPSFMIFKWSGLVLFLFWGMLGWSSQAPQQHTLIQLEPAHSSATVALNSSANYLGGSIGTFLGGNILHHFGTPAYLPYLAGSVLMIGFVVSILNSKDVKQ